MKNRCCNRLAAQVHFPARLDQVVDRQEVQYVRSGPCTVSEREFERMKPTTINAVRSLLACSMMLLALSGCSILRKSPPPPPSKPAARPQAKPVDAKAQQHYYDLGLQYYSKENYGKAKEAFQQAVDFGPNTPLGVKAQENLKKIQQILKTLEELESK
jgi:TolA-binding protein